MQWRLVDPVRPLPRRTEVALWAVNCAWPVDSDVIYFDCQAMTPSPSWGHYRHSDPASGFTQFFFIVLHVTVHHPAMAWVWGQSFMKFPSQGCKVTYIQYRGLSICPVGLAMLSRCLNKFNQAHCYLAVCWAWKASFLPGSCHRRDYVRLEESATPHTTNTQSTNSSAH